MGTFEAGTQGAFRFEVRGLVGGGRGSWWSTSPASTTTARRTGSSRRSPGGEHRVELHGHPNLDVSVHGTEPGEPGAAGGGNATAANRIVNALPAVFAAPPGPSTRWTCPRSAARREI